MGNLMSLNTKPTIPQEIGQDHYHYEQRISPAHRIEMRLAIANLKHASATFEYAQSPGLRAVAVTANRIDPTTFNRDIKILTISDEWIVATALLDTQCHVGNWISHRLVQRLGKISSISTEFVPPKVVEASGRPVTACGVINLDLKWHPQATRNHVCPFYVFPHSDHIDVLFGVEYIASEGLLQVNELALAPLVKHKENKGDKAAIDHARETQQREKAALEERRNQKQQGGSKRDHNMRSTDRAHRALEAA